MGVAGFWCPWCSASLGDTSPERCPRCGARIAPGSALASPPVTGARPAVPADGDAMPRPPLGAKPLPSESSDPTAAQLGTWALALVVVFALLAALAYVVGRPLLDKLPKPTPPPTPTPAEVASPSPAPDAPRR